MQPASVLNLQLGQTQACRAVLAEPVTPQVQEAQCQEGDATAEQEDC